MVFFLIYVYIPNIDHVMVIKSTQNIYFNNNNEGLGGPGSLSWDQVGRWQCIYQPRVTEWNCRYLTLSQFIFAGCFHSVDKMFNFHKYAYDIRTSMNDLFLDHSESPVKFLKKEWIRWKLLAAATSWSVRSFGVINWAIIQIWWKMVKQCFTN